MGGKVDTKNSSVHVHLLLYVLLKNQLTLDQEQMLDIDPFDIGNLAFLVFQPHYIPGSSGKMFRGKKLRQALAQQRADIAALKVPKGMSASQFEEWLSLQVIRFGTWIVVKSERDKARWN
ncbi:MAG: hypothetical protein KBC69_03670 [Candidatus Magasanikbacteria bacterium]|nr:hypothetical protein [Candidatus Magasanikbacteria bacterium]